MPFIDFILAPPDFLVRVIGLVSFYILVAVFVLTVALLAYALLCRIYRAVMNAMTRRVIGHRDRLSRICLWISIGVARARARNKVEKRLGLRRVWHWRRAMEANLAADRKVRRSGGTDG